jgi:hypothetical protein
MIQPPEDKLLSFLESCGPYASSLTLAVRGIVLEDASGAIESIPKGSVVAIGFSFAGQPVMDSFFHMRFHIRMKCTGKLIRHIPIR